MLCSIDAGDQSAMMACAKHETDANVPLNLFKADHKEMLNQKSRNLSIFFNYTTYLHPYIYHFGHDISLCVCCRHINRLEHIR